MMIEYAAKQSSIQAVPSADIDALHKLYDENGALEVNSKGTNVVGIGLRPAFVQAIQVPLNGRACKNTPRGRISATARFSPANPDNWDFPQFMKEVKRSIENDRPIAIAVYIFGRKSTGQPLEFITGHQMVVVGFDETSELIFVNDTWSDSTSEWKKIDVGSWERMRSLFLARKLPPGFASEANWDIAFIRKGSVALGDIVYGEVFAVLGEASLVEYALPDKWGNRFVTARLETKPCDPLYAMRRGDKWGFVDQAGQTVVPFVLERISSNEDVWLETGFGGSYKESDFFVGDLLAARSGGKWGFIDQRGAIQIAPQFEAVGSCLVSGDPIKDNCFAHGPAAVKKNGKWGYVDRSGRTVISPRFDAAGEFTDRGLATVKVGEQFGVIDAGGRYVLAPKFLVTMVFEAGAIYAQEESGRHVLFDHTGRRIADLPEYARAGYPSEGIWTLVLHDGRVGAIELASGRTAIPFQFKAVSQFSEGLAYAVSDTKRGYIDRQGVFVFTGQFDRGGSFREGLAEITLRGKSGFVDRRGRIVVEPRFDAVRDFHEGIAWVRLGNKQGYINMNGEFVVQPRFDWIGSFHADRARAQFEGKWVLVDRAGNIKFTLH